MIALADGFFFPGHSCRSAGLLIVRRASSSALCSTSSFESSSCAMSDPGQGGYPIFRPIDPLQMAQAEREFQEAYGRVMQRWARLEQAMFYWFQFVTGLNEAMARAVYYSAKNFRGRHDMLRDSIGPAALSQISQDFIRQALKKALNYNDLRNTITHGEALYDFETTSATFTQYILVQGSDLNPKARENAITIIC